MNTPDSPTPGSNPQGENGDPKVNAAEKEVITNNDDTEEVTNNDGLVADTDGITEALSESSPSTDLNADNRVTNSDGSDTNASAADEIL
jgi:hypothetical protein